MKPLKDQLSEWLQTEETVVITYSQVERENLALMINNLVLVENEKKTDNQIQIDLMEKAIAEREDVTGCKMTDTEKNRFRLCWIDDNAKDWRESKEASNV